jgi:cell division protein FtsW (lipid II flippase)
LFFLYSFCYTFLFVLAFTLKLIYLFIPHEFVENLWLFTYSITILLLTVSQIIGECSLSWAEKKRWFSLICVIKSTHSCLRIIQICRQYFEIVRNISFLFYL